MLYTECRGVPLSLLKTNEIPDEPSSALAITTGMLPDLLFNHREGPLTLSLVFLEGRKEIKKFVESHTKSPSAILAPSCLCASAAFLYVAFGSCSCSLKRLWAVAFCAGSLRRKGWQVLGWLLERPMGGICKLPGTGTC